jgi:hypothetical protein
LIPVYQTLFTGPDNIPDQQGNCFPACIASILEINLDDLPNFCAYHGPDYPSRWVPPAWYVFTNTWLTNNYNMSIVWLEGFKKNNTPEDCIEYYEADGVISDYCMGAGKSPRGDFLHGVVLDIDGNLVHDPHPLGNGIDGSYCGFDVFFDPNSEIVKEIYYGKRTA